MDMDTNVNLPRSSTKELSKGFASSSSPSSLLDETASNTSLASSSFSLSSGLTSIYSRTRISPRGRNIFFVTHPKSQPVANEYAHAHAHQSPPLSKAKPKIKTPTNINIHITSGINSNNNNSSNINISAIVKAKANRSNQCNINSNTINDHKKSCNVEASGGVQKIQPRRLPHQILLAILSLNRDQVVWEEMEDDLYILLEGKLERLKTCKEFYFQGTTQNNNNNNNGGLTPRLSCGLLRSLGYLLSSETSRDMAMHDEHIARVANFLSIGRYPRHPKLAVVQCLYKMCLLTTAPIDHHGGNTSVEIFVEQLFEFLTTRTREWGDDIAGNLSPTAIPLLYELRARCLRDLDLERERIRSVTDKGDSTAVLIATGAKIVELGIKMSNKAIEGRINNAGKKMRGWIDDGNKNSNSNIENQQFRNQNPRKFAYHNNTSDRDAVVVRAFSGSAKRASEYAQQSSKLVAQSTIDTTLSGLYSIGNKFDETTKITNQISPETQEIIRAAGKVGMASVGAVALVAEAIMKTSKSVSSRTVGVTADIVGHKYGSVVGEVARDAADTYDNVLQTMGNITLVSNGTKLVKTAAKNAGKNQIDGDVEKAKEIILNLERQGAIVAKHALGIQWTEGTLTKELICAPSYDDDDDGDGSEWSHPNYLNKNEKLPLGSRNDIAMGTMQLALEMEPNGEAGKKITSPQIIDNKRIIS